MVFPVVDVLLCSLTDDTDDDEESSNNNNNTNRLLKKRLSFSMHSLMVKSESS